jgi:hypothetical protein
MASAARPDLRMAELLTGQKYLVTNKNLTTPFSIHNPESAIEMLPLSLTLLPARFKKREKILRMIRMVGELFKIKVQP